MRRSASIPHEPWASGARRSPRPGSSAGPTTTTGHSICGSQWSSLPGSAPALCPGGETDALPTGPACPAGPSRTARSCRDEPPPWAAADSYLKGPSLDAFNTAADAPDSDSDSEAAKKKKIDWDLVNPFESPPHSPRKPGESSMPAWLNVRSLNGPEINLGSTLAKLSKMMVTNKRGADQNPGPPAISKLAANGNGHDAKSMFIRALARKTPEPAPANGEEDIPPTTTA